ncbi:MAG TPA: TetR/AcrR family transcriptional regulator [Thermomicrobiales bacterium]|nr:TetR/AcrR family transcriptional regulator [Thermomicrobiales bacterium]
MTIEDRRRRDRVAQRQLITATARSLAEREGWDAVTTRRLSAEIEYSQPVIYKHFASLDDLVEAVALEGFSELAESLGLARGTASPDDVVAAVGRAYSAWAVENPALYDAMFARATRLTFGADDTPAPMSSSYAELRSAVATIAGERDVDTLTEVLWAALHGLITLDRNGRLRPNHDIDRIDVLIAQFRSPPPGRLTSG